MVKISKTSIRSLERYIEQFNKDEEVLIVYPFSNFQQIERAGFKSTSMIGDVILPTIIGKATKENANGRYIYFKDRPKERRYINTVTTKHSQFRGRYDREEVWVEKDIYKKCWKRELIPPEEIEFSISKIDSQKVISSPVFKIETRQFKRLKLAINVMLELFGSCEIISGSARSLSLPIPKKIKWRMLPPGEHPFEKISDHITMVLDSSNKITDPIVLDRQKTLHSYKPDSVYVGEGGFSEYVAYEFKSHGIVILESINYGNALYAFSENWKEISKLSKAEILNCELHEERIVHSKGWKNKLQRLLNSRRKDDEHAISA